MSKVKITGKVLVIQLGREETRIALMGKGSEILRTVTLTTPEEAVEDGMIRNPEAVRDMLKTALKQDSDFKRIRQVVFALCTSQVITENVMVPDLNGTRLEKLIQSNMDTYFPVDVRDYRVVWQALGSRQEEGGMKEQSIQLWAIPNAMLARYYKVANDCGLSVAAIDYCGNSIATAAGLSFARKAAKGAKSGLKLDLKMEIGFGSKKKAEAEPVTTSDSGATATATRTVADTRLYVSLDKDLLGMTFAQEGQVVYQRFVPCGMDPSYQLGELAMMVEYYQSMESGRGSNIRGVVLGTLADDDMLVADLQDVLGIPLGRFRGDCAPGMAFCVGAARTNMDFGDPTMNKVTTARTQMMTQLWQYGFVLAGGLALIAVVMFTLSARLVWNMNISSLETTKQALQIQAAKVAGFADNYYKYENNYNSYDADWETVFSNLRTYNDNLVLMLGELEEIMPENSSVTGLQIAADGMNVTFACASKEEAAYLIMALRELKYADLNAISNLSGGGGGPATSYGSGNSGEKAPSEGSGPNRFSLSQIIGNTIHAVDPTEETEPVFEIISSEVTEEEMAEVVKDLTDQQLLLLGSTYGKTPGVDADAEADPDAEPRTLEAMTETHGGTTAAEKKQFLEARMEAMRTMLTTDLFAQNGFVVLLNQDLRMPAQASVMQSVILDDLDALAALGLASKGPDGRYLVTAETLILLADALVQDETHLAATEALVCSDEQLELTYVYYLEVQLELREAEAFPWLDKSAMTEDVMDGGFATGDEELDGKLDATISEEAWEFADIVNSENGVETGVAQYMATGTSGNTYLDDAIESYNDHDTTGNTRLDTAIGSAMGQTETDLTQEQVDEMVDQYLQNGTTGNAAYDAMMEQFISAGTTGDAELDTMIEEALEKLAGSGEEETTPALTDAQIAELMDEYLEKGTTGNAAYDAMFKAYLDNGTTGNSDVDAGIDAYINNRIDALTEDDIADMMDSYLSTGSTGDKLFDNLMLKYLINGTTGIAKLDTMIEAYMDNMGGEEEPTEPVVTEPVVTEPKPTEPVVTEPKPTEPVITEPARLTKAQMFQLVDAYINDGTTGDTEHDTMISAYLDEGTTGDTEYDGWIDEYINDMAENLTSDEMNVMMNSYLSTGTTGSKVYDKLLLKYLISGSTGVDALDALIEEYMNNMGGEEDPTEPTEPVVTEPKPTEPVVTEPKPTEPVVTEPKPTEPVVTEPKPTEPVVTEPARLTKAQMFDLVDAYVNDGTTGDTEHDTMIKTYLNKGTTGDAEYDGWINECINEMAENLTDEEMNAMMNSYLTTGSTGNQVYDSLLLKYLLEGSTGVDALDALIEEYMNNMGGEEDPTEPTEPVVTEPKPTEPVVTEPKPTEPVVTEPKPTEPIVTEPARLTRDQVFAMVDAYINDGTTGDAEHDIMIKAYLNEGTTGDAEYDGWINECINEMAENLTDEEMNAMMNSYLTTGSTGNRVYDSLLMKYLLEGSTGVDALDQLIDDYMNNMGGGNDDPTEPTEPVVTEPKPTEPVVTEPKPTEPEVTEPKPTEPARLTRDQVFAMVDAYVNDGTTGNAEHDTMIKAYLNKGTTGDAEYDGWINECINEMAENLTDEEMNAMMNSYLTTGSTGNRVYDSLLMKYLLEGSTGVDALDQLINDYMNNMGGGNDDPTEPTEPVVTEPKPTEPEVTEPKPTDPNATDPAGLTQDQMNALLDAYINNGTTGNTEHDTMINGYLNKGTTGDTEYDAWINAYINEMAENLTDAELNTMMNSYLTTGTTGNQVYDSLLMKYLMNGSTGVPSLDQLIQDYLNNMGGGNQDPTEPTDPQPTEPKPTETEPMEPTEPEVIVVPGHPSLGLTRGELKALLKDYITGGTSGEAVLDTLFEAFMTEGSTGHPSFDEVLKDIMVEIENEDPNNIQIDKILMKVLMMKYIEDGTTGILTYDLLIEKYIEDGTTGRSDIDRIIEENMGEILGEMDDAEIGELMDKYLEDGTTGNPLFDQVIERYLMEGTTGIPALDEKLEEYMKNQEGGSQDDSNKEQMKLLLEKYMKEGTTGIPLYDMMIEKYINTGTTGNADLDKAIEEYMGEMLGELTDEEIGEMMDKYLEDGTTGNKLYDKLIEKYLAEGTTGIPELDEKIDDYMAAQGGDGGFTKDKVAEMLDKYLTEGTTGNDMYDVLIEKYLKEGTTGNPALDKMIDESMDDYFTDEKVEELLDKYLEDGTTGNEIMDDLFEKYLNEGSTGNDKLDKLIKDYMKDAIGGDGELTPEVIEEMMDKYLTYGTTGNDQMDKLIYKYITEGSTGIPAIDKMIEDYMNKLMSGGGSGGIGGGGSMAPQDTRIYFSVSLSYKEELKSAELARKGLYYDKKISKLEVEE